MPTGARREEIAVGSAVDDGVDDADEILAGPDDDIATEAASNGTRARRRPRSRTRVQSD